MARRHEIRTIDLSDSESCLIGALSDTHSRPHPNLFPLLEQRRPSLILHAGDVGDLDLIEELETVCQVVFVRGNVDPSGRMWPDSMTLHVKVGNTFRVDLLLLHFALVQLRLNKDAVNLLRQHPAQIVVFGHSHIPVLGADRNVHLFNPGSAGPSRMGLPTTMGFIEIASGQLRFKHLDLQTGEVWKPTQGKAPRT
jgi:putative phosphoesterase